MPKSAPGRVRRDRAGVLVLCDGRLLVMHRRKFGEDYDAIPGGTLERGESPEAAAIREIWEETGLHVVLVGPVFTFLNQGRREYYFDASNVVGRALLGGAEARRNSPENHYALGWIPVNELGRRPLRPQLLRDWLAARDWRRFPGV